MGGVFFRGAWVCGASCVPVTRVGCNALWCAANENEEDADERPDPAQMFSVLVHVRSFLKFLNAHVVSTTTIACTSDTLFSFGSLPGLAHLNSRVYIQILINMHMYAPQAYVRTTA